MSWLRKGRDPDEFELEEPRSEALYVPASQRPRPMPEVNLDDGDGSDEQVEFLASLVNEIDREQSAPAAETAPSTRFNRRRMDTDDDMWAFRETVTTTDPYEGLRKYTAQEVELDELIDDLSLTMAALRHRRAA
jgi:hypothetical protein